MDTPVHLQRDFRSVVGELLALEHAAIAAYGLAIARVHAPDVRQQLQAFIDDHERHIRELEYLLHELGGVLGDSNGIGRQGTHGAVTVASLFGDRIILEAIKNHEDDTNMAYEQAALFEQASKSARAVLRGCLADERRHRSWIEETVSLL